MTRNRQMVGIRFAIDEDDTVFAEIAIGRTIMAIVAGVIIVRFQFQRCQRRRAFDHLQADAAMRADRAHQQRRKDTRRRASGQSGSRFAAPDKRIAGGTTR